MDDTDAAEGALTMLRRLTSRVATQLAVAGAVAAVALKVVVGLVAATRRPATDPA